MWSSRMDQKWKYLRVFILLLAITMNKNPNGAAMTNEELTELVNEIQKNYKVEKSQMESTISSLQAKLYIPSTVAHVIECVCFSLFLAKKNI